MAAGVIEIDLCSTLEWGLGCGCQWLFGKLEVDIASVWTLLRRPFTELGAVRELLLV